MGYGVAMPKQSYTLLSAEDRETLSLGLTHGHSLRTMARVLGRAVPRARPQPTAKDDLQACSFSLQGWRLIDLPLRANLLTRPPSGTSERAIIPGEGLPILTTSCQGSG
jgi:hypothetical protein